MANLNTYRGRGRARGMPRRRAVTDPSKAGVALANAAIGESVQNIGKALFEWGERQDAIKSAQEETKQLSEYRLAKQGITEKYQQELNKDLSKPDVDGKEYVRIAQAEIGTFLKNVTNREARMKIDNDSPSYVEAGRLVASANALKIQQRQTIDLNLAVIHEATDAGTKPMSGDEGADIAAKNYIDVTESNAALVQVGARTPAEAEVMNAEGLKKIAGHRWMADMMATTTIGEDAVEGEAKGDANTYAKEITGGRELTEFEKTNSQEQATLEKKYQTHVNDITADAKSKWTAENKKLDMDISRNLAGRTMLTSTIRDKVEQMADTGAITAEQFRRYDGALNDRDIVDDDYEESLRAADIISTAYESGDMEATKEAVFKHGKHLSEAKAISWIEKANAGPPEEAVTDQKLVDGLKAIDGIIALRQGDTEDLKKDEELELDQVKMREEWRQWKRDHPDATPAQEDEALKSIMEPAQKEVTKTWLTTLWQTLVYPAPFNPAVKAVVKGVKEAFGDLRPLQQVPTISGPPSAAPITEDEFEANVGKLKATDMKAAREYYDKWANEFK